MKQTESKRVSKGECVRLEVGDRGCYQEQEHNGSFGGSGGRRRSEIDQWRDKLVSVFIGNINPLGKEKALFDAVMKHGRVVDFYFPFPKAGCKMSTYGFFRFKDSREALTVIRVLNGSLWDVKKLAVKIANPKKPTSMTPSKRQHQNSKTHSRPSHNPAQQTTPPPPPASPIPNLSYYHSYADILKSNPSNLGSSIPNPFTQVGNLTTTSSTPPSNHSPEPITLEQSDLDTAWLEKAAIAKVKSPGDFSRFESLAQKKKLNSMFTITTLGGSLVLLRFNSHREMLDLISRSKVLLDDCLVWVRPWKEENR